jgi:hypothetical protein
MGLTPLSKKLLVKPGLRMLVLNVPAGQRDQLGELPAEPDAAAQAKAEYDWVLAYAKNSAELAQVSAIAFSAIKETGVLWFSYPKKTSKLESDLSRDLVWERLAGSGWRPVTQIAIDETWSALRFRPEHLVEPK